MIVSSFESTEIKVGFDLSHVSDDGQSTLLTLDSRHPQSLMSGIVVLDPL